MSSGACPHLEAYFMFLSLKRFDLERKEGKSVPAQVHKLLGKLSELNVL